MDIAWKYRNASQTFGWVCCSVAPFVRFKLRSLLAGSYLVSAAE